MKRILSISCKTLLFFLLTSLLAPKTFAQSNFNGSYHLDKEKTQFGVAPVWVVPQDYTIRQNAHNLVIEESQLDPQSKPHRDTLNLSANGSVFQNFSYSHKTQKFTLAWDADGKGFTVTRHSFTDDGQPFLNTSDHWSKTDDQTLTIETNVEQVSNHYKYKLILYYRQ